MQPWTQSDLVGRRWVPGALEFGALLLFSFLFCLAAGTADDWPQWRGPGRDQSWKREQPPVLSSPPKVLWRIPAGGGYASPVVWEGRGYILDSILQKPRAWERLRCVDLDSGRLLWTETNSVSYPDYCFDPNNRGGPNASCLVEHGRVYSIGANGDLFCRDARAGRILWGTNLTESCGLRDYAAVTPSPLIEQDLLITAPGGDANATVVAFDKETGRERWRALKDSWTYSSPIVITAGGARELILWTQDAVNSLDPATGRLLWREKISTPGDMTVSTPVFRAGRLLAGGLMFRLGPTDRDHQVLWPESIAVTKRVFSNTSTPCMQEDLVFTGTTAGKLICLRSDTGKLLWETNSLTAPGNGSSLHITAVKDAFLIFTDQGDLIQVQLSESGCREISRVHLIDPLHPFGGRKVIWPPPVFARDSVLVRNDEEVIRVDLGR